MRLTQTVVDWPLRRARLDADEAYAAIARIGFDGVEMVPRDRSVSYTHLTLPTTPYV